MKIVECIFANITLVSIVTFDVILMKKGCTLSIKFGEIPKFSRLA